MALSQLELRQSQLLVMTPQLMQAIKLLQLSNLDLVAYVEAELERNPLLERAEGEDEPGEAPEAEPAGRRRRRRERRGSARNGWRPSLEGVRGDRGQARHRPRQYLSRTTTAGPPPRRRRRSPADSWAAAPTRADAQLRRLQSRSLRRRREVARRPSLRPARHGDRRSDALRLVGQAIISEIDEAGYFRADLAEIAERLGAPHALSSKPALSSVQDFEPAGVGARDLAECLAIQLRERDRLRPGDGGAARQSRPRRQARPRRAAEALPASTATTSPRCSPSSAPSTPSRAHAFGEHAGPAGHS